MKVRTRVNRHFLTLLAIVLISFFPQTNESAHPTRVEPKIPDIPGFYTLKCDLHMHTVFSDGYVWPTVRPQEAWREGYHAIAITDHIEPNYLKHKKDIRVNRNRSYQLALPVAELLNLILIQGGEITRGMPPGHFNGIFLKDVEALNKKNYMDAFKAAADQGAFITWNHPGRRQENKRTKWYPIHTELLEKGWLHGIEVANSLDYYPNAQKFALEKNLTMVGGSDVHLPSDMGFDHDIGEQRPATLVFVKNKSPDGIKEALFAQRTAVYFDHKLAGLAKYLTPIFYKSIEIINPSITIKGRGKAYLQIRNNSEIPYELETEDENSVISFPKQLTLQSNKTTLISIRSKSRTNSGEKEITLKYKVKNLLVAPDEGLPIEIKIKINFIPVEKD